MNQAGRTSASRTTNGSSLTGSAGVAGFRGPGESPASPRGKQQLVKYVSVSRVLADYFRWEFVCEVGIVRKANGRATRPRAASPSRPGALALRRGERRSGESPSRPSPRERADQGRARALGCRARPETHRPSGGGLRCRVSCTVGTGVASGIATPGSASDQRRRRCGATLTQGPGPCHRCRSCPRDGARGDAAGGARAEGRARGGAAPRARAKGIPD